MKKTLGVLSVAVGGSAYLYMVVSTAKGTGEGLLLSTFALWAALSWIACLSMLKRDAPYIVPMIYGTGATAITGILLFKERFGWTGLDTVTTILVILCIALWIKSGPRAALILSVVAGIIASVPFTVITWRNPENSPIIPNIGCWVANALGFVAAERWTLEDRLFFATNVVLCSLLIVPWLLL